MKLNCVISFLLLAFPVLAMAQASKPIQTASPQPPTALISPEVHANGSVTFRFRAPNAKEVKLGLEGAEAVAMQSDSQGVWSVTTAPLSPDYYGYSFYRGWRPAH